MRELSYVGISDDGAALVLEDPQGQRYAVALDDRLTTSIRRDRPRAPAQNPDEPMRPKDIQARIRAGATTEEVADMAGWDLERVRRFEGPVLAERAWVAEQARGTQVRRHDEEAVLESVVIDRLVPRGVDPEALRWDSWRREDGRWTVLLAYPASHGDRVATWVFDTSVRTLQADDEEARWLIEPPISDSEAARLRLVGTPGTADEHAGPAQNDTVPVRRGSGQPGDRPSDHDVAGPIESDGPPADQAGGEDRHGDAVEQRAAADAPPPVHGRTTRRARRASIPTWDEILFGSGRPEE